MVLSKKNNKTLTDKISSNINYINNVNNNNYIFPAEWLEHEGILLAWPHDKITFPDVKKVELAFIKIISSLNKSEKVNLLVTGSAMRKKVQNMFTIKKLSLNNITFYEHNYADVWFRDYGPTFLVNTALHKRAIVKWTFNAYGNKYKTLLKDNVITLFLNKKMNLPVFNAGIVCEGGAIETNGNGVLLTTTSCLLNNNRNPNKSKNEIEKVLKNILNIKKVIWLDYGIIGDDTDGHIDNLARFVNDNIILCTYANKNDENFRSLNANFQKLSKSTDINGKSFKIIKLPLPLMYSKDKSRRLSASYANFYIGNTVVLVPQFNLSTDKVAISILKKVFPKRKIIGIDCSNLIYGGGTLHCISQQIPKI
jgi:agmatine deiminase